MSRKRVAIVGLGIGRAHLEEGYSQLKDLYEVTALCDLDQGRLDAVGEAFGVAHKTKDFEELLTRADVDIIDICTPPSLHLQQSLKALAANKHVICEKPLVGSLKDCDLLAQALEKSGGSLMPIFQYRWGTGFQKAKYLVDHGLTGKPYVASCETHWLRGADYYEIAWRGKLKVELGGVLLSQAIHLHDMMCALMGQPERIYVESATRVNPIEVEDCAVATLKMDSGALVTLNCTLGAKKEISRLKACFEHVTITSHSEAYAPGNDPWQFDCAPTPAGKAVQEALEKVPPVDPRFKGQMVAYHAALAGKGPWPVTLADARRSLEMITAFYESAASHQAVSLPIPQDHRLYDDWRKHSL
jgi:predicted dehydrogenase